MVFNSHKLDKDYEIVSLISETNFGRVYKVLHKQTGQFRCMKMYVKDRMKKTVQNNFPSELDLLRELDHPNIFRVYEFAEEPQSFYLISEYLSGGELFDAIIKAQSFSENEARLILKQILYAINYLHLNGIAHRDIKPENLMLAQPDRIDQLKLIDFGTAKRFQSGTKMKEVLGTAYYMAPEIFTQSYDEKVDVWACGVIAFILLSGHPPFNAATDPEIHQKIVEDPVMFSQSAWKDVTKEAIDFISQMLSKDPSKRPSIASCLKHPWFVQKEPDQPNPHPIGNYLENIREFTATCRMARTLRMFMISHFCGEDKRLERMDGNKDGCIDREELKEACEKTNQHLEYAKILQEVDVNCDNMINFSEFVMAAIKFQRNFFENQFEEVFALMDCDRNGKLTRSELAAFFKRNPEDEFVNEMFVDVDANKDGLITLGSFRTSVSKKYLSDDILLISFTKLLIDSQFLK